MTMTDDECGSTQIDPSSSGGVTSDVRVTVINKSDRVNPEAWIPATYPPEAMAARVEGVVIVEFSVEPDGKVGETRVVRSNPMLDRATLDAVRRWQFTSARRFGSVLRDTQTVAMSFTLR